MARPPNKNSNEIQFIENFPIEEDPLNGLTFQGLYMPEEIMVNIFANLSLQDILTCSLVCKNWFNVAKSNILWHTIYNSREYPKKAKNLPWYVFYCYFTTENFKNLLKNGNGEEEFKHWQIVANGGHYFSVETEPIGSDPLPLGVPEFHGHTSCFVTSFEDCVKYQIIDIESKKLLQHIIRKYHPTLYASEWFAGRFDCGCVYKLLVKCDIRGAETGWNQFCSRGSWIHNSVCPVDLVTKENSKSVEGRVEQWAGQAWEKLEVLYEDYPNEIDIIYFWHMGRDTKFWAGRYGSKMAGGVLKFLFDSIEPAPESNMNVIV